MMELLNVYRVQFFKREPIYVASTSYMDALASIMKDPKLRPEDGDEITSVTHTPHHQLFV